MPRSSRKARSTSSTNGNHNCSTSSPALSRRLSVFDSPRQNSYEADGATFQKSTPLLTGTVFLCSEDPEFGQDPLTEIEASTSVELYSFLENDASIAGLGNFELWLDGDPLLRTDEKQLTPGCLVDIRKCSTPPFSKPPVGLLQTPDSTTQTAFEDFEAEDIFLRESKDMLLAKLVEMSGDSVSVEFLNGVVQCSQTAEIAITKAFDQWVTVQQSRSGHRNIRSSASSEGDGDGEGELATAPPDHWMDPTTLEHMCARQQHFAEYARRAARKGAVARRLPVTAYYAVAANELGSRIRLAKVAQRVAASRDVRRKADRSKQHQNYNENNQNCYEQNLNQQRKQQQQQKQQHVDIDLHEHTVTEAVAVVQDCLLQRQIAANDIVIASFRIIVGTGKHSRGQFKLGPAVLSYLKQTDCDYEDSINECGSIFIPKRQSCKITTT